MVSFRQRGGALGFLSIPRRRKDTLRPSLRRSYRFPLSISGPKGLPSTLYEFDNANYINRSISPVTITPQSPLDLLWRYAYHQFPLLLHSTLRHMSLAYCVPSVTQFAPTEAQAALALRIRFSWKAL